VTNATSLSIDGLGTVSGTSVPVAPKTDTTYALTASSPVGTVTAQTTVAVFCVPSVWFTPYLGTLATDRLERLLQPVQGERAVVHSSSCDGGAPRQSQVRVNVAVPVTRSTDLRDPDKPSDESCERPKGHVDEVGKASRHDCRQSPTYGLL